MHGETVKYTLYISKFCTFYCPLYLPQCVWSNLPGDCPCVLQSWPVIISINVASCLLPYTQ